jgi:hypothetical protein
MIYKVNDNSVRLCCKKVGCPVVTELADGMIEIVDDDGNRVVVKKEEALLISDGVKTIDAQKLILG